MPMRPALLAAISAQQFSPSGLFSAGEVGAWFDPSDFTTMFQDNLGTTPVTATGQPVGLIRDKSGRGNHASQATSTSRPVLQQEATGQYYLAFDGTDDSLATASIDFSATDKMTVWAGVRKLSDAAVAALVELSSNVAVNNGVFNILAPRLAPSGGPYSFYSKGTVTADAISSNAAFNAPNSAVITGIGDISNDSSIVRLNGAQSASVVTDQGTGNYGNYPLYIGMRGGTTLPYNGRLYSLIVRGAASTADQISKAETWVNGKTGAY